MLLEPTFLADPDIQPWASTQRRDLLASNTPIIATGQFVVFSYKVPANMCLVVKSMAFFADERINVGAADESFRALLPRDADGFFSFQPLVDRKSPFTIDISVNSPKIAAGPLNGLDLTLDRGYTNLSSEPLNEVMRSMNNPFFSIVVPSNKTLEVIFKLLPISTLDSAEIPAGGQYQIGVGVTKRVDFAGAVAAGLLMPQQVYNSVATKRGEKWSRNE